MQDEPERVGVIRGQEGGQLDEGTHQVILLAHKLYHGSDWSTGISFCVDESAKRPNGLRISRRERAAYESAKIATISRAKRSVACACWVAHQYRHARM